MRFVGGCQWAGNFPTLPHGRRWGGDPRLRIFFFFISFWCCLGSEGKIYKQRGEERYMWTWNWVRVKSNPCGHNYIFFCSDWNPFSLRGWRGALGKLKLSGLVRDYYHSPIRSKGLLDSMVFIGFRGWEQEHNCSVFVLFCSTVILMITYLFNRVK